MTLKDILDRLARSVEKQTNKTWKKAKVKCNKCGHEWNPVYLNIKGGEKKLQCPRCKTRDSSLVN